MNVFSIDDDDGGDGDDDGWILDRSFVHVLVMLRLILRLWFGRKDRGKAEETRTEMTVT